MKTFFILHSVFVLLLSPTAHSQEKTCEDVTIQNCPSFFTDSCRNDVKFQKKNGFACLKVLNNNTQNQAFCVNVDMDPCKPEERDCSSTPNIEERIRCEDGFPKCTRGTPELKKRFNDLGKAVEAELESYGGVLDLDLDNVGDKKTLCGLTFDSMEMYHKQANMTDTPINRFLEQSRDIASCAKEITTWVENQEIDVADSDLQDELIKATAEDLKDLQPLREKLNHSVSKLKEAGPKLYQLMKFHYRFCPNKKRLNIDQAAEAPVEKMISEMESLTDKIDNASDYEKELDALRDQIKVLILQAEETEGLESFVDKLKIRQQKLDNQDERRATLVAEARAVIRDLRNNQKKLVLIQQINAIDEAMDVIDKEK